MNRKICVVGLGYVGEPLANALSKKFTIFGLDTNRQLIKKLRNADKNYPVYDEIQDVPDCCTYIITVPTPVDKNHVPDFSPLINACSMIGERLKKNDLIIFESTVFPGATEEVLIPKLEEISGLFSAKDFGVGYSPERVSPGKDSVQVTEIIKITSANTMKWLEIVDGIYSSIIVAGTHRARSIKVAEAAKVLENTQRDVNIALINEFSSICDRIDISTTDVLEAASTKWNFLKFSPGLVGGHCIGVDPYYLAHKAKALGFYPELIEAARRVNESVIPRLQKQLINDFSNSNKNLAQANILILGLTFKENCNDYRNSKAIEFAEEASKIVNRIDYFDPYIKSDIGYGNMLTSLPVGAKYDAIFILVKHDEFLKLNKGFLDRVDDCIIYDVLNIYNNDNYFSL
jgi:UDP-N-acetyl-D-glucosamine/UDP-N-acetyl-D-galactosamine dehydrogenase